MNHRILRIPGVLWLALVWISPVPFAFGETDPMDVTLTVAAAIRDGKLSIPAGNEKFGDTAPGVSKRLHVEYAIGAEKFTRDIPETGTLELSAPAGQKLVILRAIYGPGDSPETAGAATPASSIQVHEGFAVELLYSVPRARGSWVAMCFDDRGRLYASEQGPRLFRFTPPVQGKAPWRLSRINGDTRREWRSSTARSTSCSTGITRRRICEWNRSCV